MKCFDPQASAWRRSRDGGRARHGGQRASPPTTIGESSPILSNPNQQAITRGEQLAAKTFGWTVKTIDANLSADKQVSDVDTLVNLGVKGLITWTLDAGAAGAAYKRALDKGIPVVDYGSTSNVTTVGLRRAGLRLHGRHQGRRVHRQARPQGQGARDRRARRCRPSRTTPTAS